ncbi:MAG: bifunctional diaminohydroxyphosphoribosylaminopyrimidine deaminase/5-amino-6-(5-phosphoribosylamino)uracil reductase RibD [Gemmatimonadetes bacterium]|nr:bifunctional diaminohydroxyphosphoribosylaminopyrimidine deaminase/5-amino-6-(5-phosphoribosylamino)uracil reductase RibD [Gemmatimonadota bacterium]
MGRALELAWRGWGRVAPNPLVGAVVVRNGAIVGEGWHAEFGERHAEPAALAMAGAAARGATLYVTLEPCNHTGKQPPCADALIAAGVARVVVAMPDPNPEAQGGALRLRAAGIPVEIGCRGEEAAVQNAIFLHRFTEPRRPFLALKLATTLDGRIADHGGRSRWISGGEAREYVHWLRAGFDAIGVGGHTARTDDASLTVRGPVEPRVAPQRVVFDRLAELPSTLALVKTAGQVPTTLVTTLSASLTRTEPLEAAGVRVIRAATLAVALQGLHEEGVGSILVEGGGRLAGRLLGEGLVDRYYWIQSPLWLGDSGIPAIAELPGTSLVEAERWQVVDRRALGQDTLLVVDREPCSPAS